MDADRDADSLANSSLIADTPETDHVKILVATDLHVGYGEQIVSREMESVRTFEEVLQIAVKENVDFVLLGGDLYHENVPSREMQLRVTRLLRRYCFNDRPVALKFLSDPAVNFTHSVFNNVNYEDSNINIGLPIFTIHGNHDDLTGKGLTALDLLHEAGLINLFGKFEEIDKFVVSPILLNKGKTNLAIYGIGSQRDDRLCRAFREEEIRFLRPRENAESWFNILILHQNRPQRSNDRSTGAHVPESLIPSFFDLVIWGHEHECKIEPQYYESSVNVCGDGFYLMQPGSTIATALSAEEALPKHVAVLTVSRRKFFCTAIKLETPRQILFDDLMIDIKPPSGASKTHRPKSMPDEKLIAQKIDEMLREGKRTRGARQPELPLLRLRVVYPESWANIMKLNCRRFGMNYSSEVANPSNMVTIKILRPKIEHRKVELERSLFDYIERTTTLEEIVNRQFSGRGSEQLTVLTSTMLNEVVNAQIGVDEGKRGKKEKPLVENINAQKERLIDALRKVNYDAQLIDPKTGAINAANLERLVAADILKARNCRIGRLSGGKESD